MSAKHIAPSLPASRSRVGHRVLGLVALLALLRKFIILDLDKTGAATIAALAFATLALGGIYWMIRRQDAERSGAQELAADQGSRGSHGVSSARNR